MNLFTVSMSPAILTFCVLSVPGYAMRYSRHLANRSPGLAQPISRIPSAGTLAHWDAISAHSYQHYDEDLLPLSLERNFISDEERNAEDSCDLVLAAKGRDSVTSWYPYCKCQSFKHVVWCGATEVATRKFNAEAVKGHPACSGQQPYCSKYANSTITTSLVDRDAVQEYKFLPFDMRGVRVLRFSFDLADPAFLVDNSLLQSTADALDYRRSKNMEDKDPGPGARYGEKVEGLVEESPDGKKWLKVKSQAVGSLHDVVRQGEFLMHSSQPGQLRRVTLVLQRDQVSLYSCVFGCTSAEESLPRSMDERCRYRGLEWSLSISDAFTTGPYQLTPDHLWQHSDAAVERTSCDSLSLRNVSKREQLPPASSISCVRIQSMGFTHLEVDVTLCLESTSELKQWMAALDTAYVGVTTGSTAASLTNRVAFEVGQAVKKAVYDGSHGFWPTTHRGSPWAFSPLLCSRPGVLSKSVEESAFEMMLDAAVSFKHDCIEQHPGNTSRSGADFFWSAGRRYIAKLVRQFEYEALWDLTRDEHPNPRHGCSLSKHFASGFEGAESHRYQTLLNPTAVAFKVHDQSGGAPQHFIVMKAEKVPQEIKKLLPYGSAFWSENFFQDVKPKPMVSDRVSFGKLMMDRQIRTGFKLSPLMGDGRFGGAPAAGMYQALQRDTAFLKLHGLVDYSLLFYGTFLDLDLTSKTSVAFFSDKFGSQARERLRREVQKKQPQCTFGCSERPQNLMDVTPFMNTTDHYLHHQGNRYSCCCLYMNPGESASMKSPCALFKLSSAGGSLFRNKFGCMNLMGHGFHSYYRNSTKNPQTQGRCLVAPDAFHSDSKYLDPTVLKNGFEGPYGYGATPATEVGHVASCGVVCVSIIDILLEYTLTKQVENFMLAPVYGSLKWTDYKPKIEHLFKCLAGVPIAQRNESYHSVLYEPEKSWSYWKHAGPKSCAAEVFAELEDNGARGIDAEVIQGLVAES